MIGERFETEVGIVEIRSTDRADGSFALDEPAGLLAERRRRVLGEADRSWVGLRQVHGTTVIDTAEAGVVVDPAHPPQADASITLDPSLAVAVLTADCAPVVLVGSNGVAAVHAGWRGAVDGVIDRAAAALRSHGADPVATFLGPCIQPEHYEFGAADLELISDVFGPDVVGRTVSGSPALDLTRTIQLSCERAGWPAPSRPPCTSDSRFFSHRTRRDVGRQTTVAWIESPTDPEHDGPRSRGASGSRDASPDAP